MIRRTLFAALAAPFLPWIRPKSPPKPLETAVCRPSFPPEGSDFRLNVESDGVDIWVYVDWRGDTYGRRARIEDVKTGKVAMTFCSAVYRRPITS
jgi:hypothetical protein